LLMVTWFMRMEMGRIEAENGQCLGSYLKKLRKIMKNSFKIICLEGMK
jgi:hypothetical protein